MINCIGQMFGSSGYASHFRGLVNELNKLVPCKILTNLPNGFERDVNDQELEMIKLEQDYDINLIITHPLNWKSNLSGKRNFVYLICEGDKIPKWVLEECMNDNIEKIIVPSTHTKQALLNTLKIKDGVNKGPNLFVKITGDKEKDKQSRKLNDLEHIEFSKKIEIRDKIVIIPHGVDLDTFYPINSQRKKDKDDGSNDALSVDTKQLQGQNKKDEHMPVSVDNNADSPGVDPLATFKFLANKGFRNLEDRGGLQYLIRAYLQEFTNKDNVELILKINPAYGIPNLLEMFPELNKPDIPKIIYIPENYTKRQLNELYNECDVFVSPTRSEAFNLPCLESLACGKPVIATNYGGQVDFIDVECGWLIDYNLVDVKHEIEYEGIRWATIKHEKLKRALRFTYENPKICKAMSSWAVSMAKCLTWKNTAKQIHSLF